MNATQTISQSPPEATPPRPAAAKAAGPDAFPNEEAGEPEGPVWGHWFNTEAMVINYYGAPADARDRKYQ